MKVVSNGLRLSFNEQNQAELTFTIPGNRYQIQSDINELKQIISEGKQLSLEVKQYRQKRSLDANALAWVYIGKIADVLRTNKDDLYIEMLKRYGQREPKLISVVSDAVDIIYRATQNHCTEVGESELNGKVFKHLAILIGSSQYDSKQFSIFLDGIISEARELNIDTITEKEKSLLMENYKGG